MITLNAPERLLTLDVPEDELERRRAEIPPPPKSTEMRGYLRMFHEHVTQAGNGCDFDFLISGRADKKTP